MPNNQKLLGVFCGCCFNYSPNDNIYIYEAIGEFPMVLRKKRNTDFSLSIHVNRLKSALQIYKTLSLI